MSGVNTSQCPVFWSSLHGPPRVEGVLENSCYWQVTLTSPPRLPCCPRCQEGSPAAFLPPDWCGRELSSCPLPSLNVIQEKSPNSNLKLGPGGDTWLPPPRHHCGALSGGKFPSSEPQCLELYRVLSAERERAFHRKAPSLVRLLATAATFYIV